ncbi:MAG TPA: hypothetical protein V6C84_05100 [Coleofasciculaceae cyanobacterium]|jgi:hypothetical protein
MSLNRLGNSFQSADSVQLNGRFVRGTLAQRSNEKFYKISISKRSSLSVNLNSSQAYNLNFRLLNDKGLTLAKSTFESIRSRRILKNLNAGAYYIGLKNRTAKTRYALKASTISFTGRSDPGSSLSAASRIGTLTENKVFQDSVGKSDQIDYYKFELGKISDFYAEINDSSYGSKMSLILDVNSNGFIDGNESIASGSGSIYVNSPISKTLPPGTYFIEVKSFSNYSDSNYRMSLTTTAKPGSLPYDPGSMIGMAYNLGDLPDTLVVKEFIGSIDKEDYYKVNLTQNSDLNATLSGLSGTVRMSLIHDANSNGFIDGGEILTSGSGSIFENSPISETLPQGAYFLAINSLDSNDTKYDLNLSIVAKPRNILDDPGSALTTATDLGTITGTSIAKDLVGSLDKTDFYKFSLSKSSNFNAALSELSDTVEISLLQDVNSNNVIDGGERVAYGNGSIYSSNPISKTLQAGSYYIEVKSNSLSNNTIYTLALTS